MRPRRSPIVATGPWGPAALCMGPALRAAQAHCLIIVAREQPELWRYMTRHFVRFTRVQVLLDRRQGERRQRFQRYEPERRRLDRRRPPRLETDLRSRPYVIVPPQPITPGA